MSRHTSSPRERINIYIGNIRKLTGDCADKKHAQSICGSAFWPMVCWIQAVGEFFGKERLGRKFLNI